MNKNKITLGVMAALLLSSTLALAESDYPAADFQPQVVFQADDIKSSATDTATPTVNSSSNADTDANFPAANFEPKVIFQAETQTNQAISEPASSVSTAPVSDDAAYPAANFEPKVIFSDAGNVSRTTTAAVTGNKPSVTVIEKSETAQVVEPANNSTFAFFGLALVVGFAFFKQSSLAKAKSKAITGYNGVTGVERYLQARDKNTLSGVARYLAKQAESIKVVADPKATSVENYLRNRS